MSDTIDILKLVILRNVDRKASFRCARKYSVDQVISIFDAPAGTVFVLDAETLSFR